MKLPGRGSFAETLLLRSGKGKKTKSVWDAIHEDAETQAGKHSLIFAKQTAFLCLIALTSTKPPILPLAKVNVKSMTSV